MITPTPRQLELLRFISAYIDRHGYAPSYDEMRLGVGLASKHTVRTILGGLEERGLIRRLPGKMRAIEVLAPPDLLTAATTGDPLDDALLEDVLAATAEPFADPVCVQGNWITRRLARQIERNLLRLRAVQKAA